jgi:hypothetical protein
MVPEDADQHLNSHVRRPRCSCGCVGGPCKNAFQKISKSIACIPFLGQMSRQEHTQQGGAEAAILLGCAVKQFNSQGQSWLHNDSPAHSAIFKRPDYAGLH